MNKKLSFLSLNIGNPSIERAKKQCEWLLKRKEDVFILTETKNSKGCIYIEEFFLQFGYDLFTMNSSLNFSVSFPKSQTGDLGVMIISKYKILKESNYFNKNDIFYSRQLEISISIKDYVIDLVGLYVPSRDRSEKKIERKKFFINEFEKYMTNSKKETKVIMGDLNILEKNHNPHYSTFFNWEYNFYDEILNNEFIDAYKFCHPDKNEYSWVGRTNNGYRYDYCFISSDLKDKLIDCYYIHDTRKNGLTDHSAIVLSLEIND